MKKDKVRSLIEVMKSDQSWTDKDIQLLCDWRNKALFAFLDKQITTKKRTRQWLLEQVVKNSDRILFFVTYKGKKVGHAGLSSFDYDLETCEIDNVVRGEPGGKALMARFVLYLTVLAIFLFEAKEVYVRVVPTNKKALDFYKSLGFTKTSENKFFVRMKYEGIYTQ